MATRPSGLLESSRRRSQKEWDPGWSCSNLDRRTFKRRDQARLEVFEFIEGFYNPRRRQSALGYVSPERFEEHSVKMGEDLKEAVAV